MFKPPELLAVAARQADSTWLALRLPAGKGLFVPLTSWLLHGAFGRDRLRLAPNLGVSCGSSHLLSAGAAMLRDFCLNCGSPLSLPPKLDPGASTNVCVCAASPELLAALERQELMFLPHYAQARALNAADLDRRVLCDGRSLTVAELIGSAYVANAIRACVPRVAEGEIVQLVYIKHVGSVLFTWPLCEAGNLAGPHRPERLRTATAAPLGQWPRRRDPPIQ
jgi:hypothetical protein